MVGDRSPGSVPKPGPLYENIERFWLDSPPCTVYDPTSDGHEQWYARQAYRVAIELAKDTHFAPITGNDFTIRGAR